MPCIRSNRRLFSILAIFLFSAVVFTACSNPEQEKAEHVRRGEQFLTEQKFQEASIEFRNAIQIDEGMVVAHWGLARAYEGLGRFNEAFGELNTITQLDPNNLEARAKRGNYFLLVQPDPMIDQAEEEAREILERDPNYIEGHILRASILAARNRPQEEILAVLNRAIEIDPNRVESYLSLARFYEQRRDAQRTEEAHRRAIAVNDRSGLAHSEYGKFLMRQNRREEAEVELRRAVEVEPESRDMRFVLASFYLITRQFDRAEEAYRGLAELDRGRPEGRSVLADFYSSVGRYDDALNIYRELATSTPDYMRARYRIAEILMQRGDVTGATREVNSVLETNERDVQALMLRARIRLQNNETNAAIEDLQNVLNLEPDSLPGLYFMSEASLRAGQIERARTFAGDLERFYPNYLPAKLLQVQVNLAARDANTALRLVNDLLQRLQTATPDQQNTAQLIVELRSKALATRGSIQSALGNVPAARRDLEMVRDASPNDPNAHVNLARLAVRENRADQAIQSFNRALELDPTNFDALSGVIIIAAAQNRMQDAHARIDAALAAQPNSAPLHFLKAQAFAYGDAARAEAELRRTLELDQNYIPAYFALSGLYVNTQQHDRAIAEYRQIAERRPTDASPYAMMGIVEESRGNREAATQNFREALTRDPNAGTAAGVIASNNLAWAAAEHGIGNLDEAIRLAQAVVQRYPNEPGFADTLGWVYYKKQLFAAAVEQLRRATSMAASRNQDSASYRYRLGMALIGAGDRMGARRELEQALRLAESGRQNFPQLEETRRALQSL